jgi:hypothetical protein
MNLEHEIRSALRRQDPPEGFAERVLRQTPMPPAALRTAPRRFGWAWAAAVAAMLVMAFAASVQYRQLQQKHAAEEAVQALQIVADELSSAQNEVLNQ